jgi:hypothetical protein
VHSIGALWLVRYCLTSDMNNTVKLKASKLFIQFIIINLKYCTLFEQYTHNALYAFLKQYTATLANDIKMTIKPLIWPYIMPVL